MNRIDAYLRIEKILNDYYEITKPNYDQLGAMLGDMDTTVWIPKEGEEIISGDPALFAEDWTDAWNRIIGTGKDGSSEQIFLVAKVILDYYSNIVEFDLGDAEYFLLEQLGLSEKEI
jgi:hypothetical protein